MQKKNQRIFQESNPGRCGLQANCSTTELKIRRRGRPALGWNQSQTNRPPGCSTLATVDLSVSRRRYAFGFMIHYNILKTEKQEKTEKLYAAFIKASNSFLIPSGVDFRPIFTATCAQVNSSNILYRIIRCILGETVLSHVSTWRLILSAFRIRSANNSSILSNSSGSLTVAYPSPSK